MALYPLVAAAAAAAMWGAVKLRTEPPRMIVSTILPPAKAQFNFTTGAPMISPDGTRIVFPATMDGVSRLWVRPLNGGTAQPLAGTEEAVHPFWSPDSRMIGFFSGTKLKKIDASGGPAQALCDAGSGRGGAWSPNGVIVFAPTPSGPLFQVADTGGNATPLTTVETAQTEIDHRWPVFMPDGRHFLYLVEKINDTDDTVYAASIDGKERTKIVVANSNVAFAPGGYLVYWRDGTLVAQRFDPSRFTLGRDIVPIAENVAHSPRNDAIFSISTKGDLVYQTGSATRSTQTTWYDSAGKPLQTIGRPADGRMVRLSNDGRRAALSLGDDAKGNEDIWVEDLVRGTTTRLTFDQRGAFMPLWSPDDARIVYTRLASGDLMVRNSSGTGPDEVVYGSDAFNVAVDWSRDGKLISFARQPKGRADFDMWLYSVADRKARPFLETTFNEIGGTFSPDGRWLAYQSNESGKEQIYVLPVDGRGGKWQISTDGGSRARWSRDGKQIFFISPDFKMTAVDVSWNADRFEAGAPHALFQTNISTAPGYNYDVSADGKRFLINSQLEQQEVAPATLVQNWTNRLRK